MLSMVYFHCKKIRNAANITANFEKSRSKISHFRPQKSEERPAKSWRDQFMAIILSVGTQKTFQNAFA